jgi:hypothetical protein
MLLPLIGFGTWLAAADYVLIPLLIASLGLAALGLYRQRSRAATCCKIETLKQES